MAKPSKRGKLDPNAPWIRCIIGPIVASRRTTPPVRRGSITRAGVLLKERQLTPKLPTEA